MIKILFIIPGYYQGGTNKILQNFISVLDKNKYNIEIFSMSTRGPYREVFEEVLPEGKVLPRNLLMASYLDNLEYILNENFLEKFKKIFFKVVFKVLTVIGFKNIFKLIYKRVAKSFDKNDYDLIIGMQEGEATHLASLTKVYKLAWVHCDYSEHLKLKDGNELDVYSKFNHIVCVSEYTKNVFISYYPTLTEKIHGIHNIIDDTIIKKLAKVKDKLDDRFTCRSFTIISVGRLSEIKQFHIIPEIASYLKDNKIEFRWYILGTGEEQQHIISEIKKHNVSDYVILLGEKSNPYPYIKKSDLFAVTSRSEAFPTVVNEAKILHIPVITTDYGSAKELIKDRVNGIITPIESMEKEIKLLISNSEYYKDIKNNIQQFTYSNDDKLKKIEKLINGY